MEQSSDIVTLQREIERLKGELRHLNTVENEREKSRHAMLIMLEDLEDSRRTIERAKQEWMNAFDAVDDPIFIHDDRYRVVQANQAYAKLAGKAFTDIVGRPYYECFPLRDGPLPTCVSKLKHDNPDGDAEEVELDNGEIFLSRAFAIRDKAGNYIHSIHIMQDITENRRAEQALRDSEAFNRTIIDSSSDCIKTLSLEGDLLTMNEAGQRLMEIDDVSLLLNTPYLDLWQREEEREAAKVAFQLARRGEVERIVGFAPTAKGNPKWWDVVISPIRDSEGEITQLLAVSRDVTELRKNERLVAESEIKYRTLFEDALDMIHTVDINNNIEDVNPAELMTLGYRKEELVGRPVLDIIRADMHELTRENYKKLFSGQALSAYATVFVASNGDEINVEVSATPRIVDGKIVGARSFIRDVTRRVEMEQKLLRENRARRVISSSNSMLVHASEESVLLNQVCGLVVAEETYPLAWVALNDDEASQLYRIAAYAGAIADEDLGMLGTTWADNEQGQGPAARAMREGRYQLVVDAQHTEACKACRQLAMKHDYHSILSFPLMKAANCFGALTITAIGINDFSVEEIALLQELADDLAYGITSLRARKDRDTAVEQQRITLKKLKTNLNTTVQAMASAVEARDPYTAGHQRHVAQLATAIATEMGLSGDEIEGIRIAATIHDIGKIYVPAEILSKPGRITPIEFELIKTHSQVGYDILKDIDFPWPVAKMVWQHHERIDGTGYPQGLKGDEIEPGAKIIAVADVTEAIASHRPYRAALGIDFALETIEKDRGTAFEPEVVDACLRLFREKDFKLDLG